MSDQFHLSLIIPLQNDIEVDELPEDLQVTLDEDHLFYNFYTRLFKKYGTNKILFKMPTEPKSILKRKDKLYMPNQFQRQVNALLRSEYLVINRTRQTIESKTVNPKISTLLFIQSIQLKSPGLLNQVCNGGNKKGMMFNQYNSRSKCCFNNLVIIMCGEENSIKFGILPHTQCTISVTELCLVHRKIMKWYCNTMEE